MKRRRGDVAYNHCLRLCKEWLDGWMDGRLDGRLLLLQRLFRKLYVPFSWLRLEKVYSKH